MGVPFPSRPPGMPAMVPRGSCGRVAAPGWFRSSSLGPSAGRAPLGQGTRRRSPIGPEQAGGMWQHSTPQRLRQKMGEQSKLPSPCGTLALGYLVSREAPSVSVTREPAVPGTRARFVVNDRFNTAVKHMASVAILTQALEGEMSNSRKLACRQRDREY